MPVVAVIGGLDPEQVMRDTWGHLAPEPQRLYPGTILFAHGAYGDIVALAVEFDGLPDSPWFFEHMNDFIGNRVCPRGGPVLPKGMYLFAGTYRLFKNGGHRFAGTVRPMRAVRGSH